MLNRDDLWPAGVETLPPGSPLAKQRGGVLASVIVDFGDVK